MKQPYILHGYHIPRNLHDQFPEEEGLKRIKSIKYFQGCLLHEQFPEEEGLKLIPPILDVPPSKLHEQFPEEEGLKRAVLARD